MEHAAVSPKERMLESQAPWLAQLAVFLGALLLVRLIALYFNKTDLFFDEAQYWSWAKEPAFGYYSKPPLIAWIIGATTKLCGDSTFCVRLPAPVLHTVTAAVIFWIGQRFVTTAAGFWSAIAFATLPGVTLSSGIISTDVPLLLCWALALLAYMEMLGTNRWWPAFLLGSAIGVGLNAKYAMAFFALSAAVHMTVTPSARRLLADPRLWTGLALGIFLILPNMAWNLSNKFATFAHTADNALHHPFGMKRSRRKPIKRHIRRSKTKNVRIADRFSCQTRTKRIANDASHAGV